MRLSIRLRLVLVIILDSFILPYRMAKGKTLGPAGLLGWWKMARFFEKYGHELGPFRIFEYLYAYRAIQTNTPNTWLDIGSGETPFVTYTMSTLKPGYAIINDPDQSRLEAQGRMLEKAGVDKKSFLLNPFNYSTHEEGQCPLDNLEMCSIVSTIEHIPDDGDIKMMNWVVGALAPGGRVVITVPASPEFQENESVTHYHGGFERRYNKEKLLERLKPEGLEVSDIQYLSIASTFTARYLTEKFKLPGLFFQYWYSNLNRINPGKFMILLINLFVISRNDQEDANICAILVELRKSG